MIEDVGSIFFLSFFFSLAESWDFASASAFLGLVSASISETEAFLDFEISYREGINVLVDLCRTERDKST